MTCMINRWRVKIDWKEVYNVKDPLRMGDCGRGAEREKKEEAMADLENPCNLVLKEEEEY